MKFNIPLDFPKYTLKWFFWIHCYCIIILSGYFIRMIRFYNSKKLMNIGTPNHGYEYQIFMHYHFVQWQKSWRNYCCCLNPNNQFWIIPNLFWILWLGHLHYHLVQSYCDQLFHFHPKRMELRKNYKLTLNKILTLSTEFAKKNFSKWR